MAAPATRSVEGGRKTRRRRRSLARSLGSLSPVCRRAVRRAGSLPRTLRGPSGFLLATAIAHFSGGGRKHRRRCTEEGFLLGEIWLFPDKRGEEREDRHLCEMATEDRTDFLAHATERRVKRQKRRRRPRSALLARPYSSRKESFWPEGGVGQGRPEQPPPLSPFATR